MTSASTPRRSCAARRSAAQSAHIDTVSGASYTSAGYAMSLAVGARPTRAMKRVELVARRWAPSCPSTCGTPVDDEAFGEAVDAVTRQTAGRSTSPSVRGAATRGCSWLIRAPVHDPSAQSRCSTWWRSPSRLMELTDGYFSPFWRRLPYGDPGPDPTGLVKGWAAQQASDILLAHGLPDHVVNAAGDVVRVRAVDPARPRIELARRDQRPAPGGDVAGVVVLDRPSVELGGGHVGYRELGAHVCDPHTGRFPRSVASATTVVLAAATRPRSARRRGGTADACATAVVAAGDQAPASGRPSHGERGRAAVRGQRRLRSDDPQGLLDPGLDAL